MNRRQYLFALIILTMSGLLGGVWIGFAGVTGSAEAQMGVQNPKIVYANAFVLVDEIGKTRARLTVVGDGPWLMLLDEKGKTRVALSMVKGGPMLMLLDEKGKTRVVLNTIKEGPGLNLLDEKGETRAILGVSTEGPLLGFMDSQGKLIWEAP